MLIMRNHLERNMVSFLLLASIPNNDTSSLIQFVIKWFESRMKNRKLEISTSTLKEALKNF